ncbi:MAG: hypothetical protein ACTS22_01580 [Phycisphaerales bacterium]
MTGGVDDGASASLTARWALVIVSVGVIALALLSYRQMRLQAMHELADARLRQVDHDKRLWEVRAEISSLVTPEQVGVLPTPGPGEGG